VKKGLNKTYSDDPSRADGGYLGYFTSDVMVEPFSKAAFKMKPGEISELVRTPYGYHIIKVEDRRKRVLTPEVMEDIRKNILLPREQTRRFKEYVKRLKDRAKIQYCEDNIKRLLRTGIGVK
jgi:parvulin-like peptidyl-prolyl isomerase